MYHFHVAPDPNIPETLVMVTVSPKLITDDDNEIDNGIDDKESINKVMLEHVVVLQVPSALKKYVVVVTGEKVLLLPENRYIPPQEPEYQFQFAPVPRLPPVNERVDDDPEHRFGGFALTDEEAVETKLTVTVELTQLVVLYVPSALTK